MTVRERLIVKFYRKDAMRIVMLGMVLAWGPRKMKQKGNYSLIQ